MLQSYIKVVDYCITTNNLCKNHVNIVKPEHKEMRF